MSPKDLVERFYHELWNRTDERVADEILGADLRFRGSLGPERQGHDGLHAFGIRGTRRLHVQHR